MKTGGKKAGGRKERAKDKICFEKELAECKNFEKALHEIFNLCSKLSDIHEFKKGLLLILDAAIKLSGMDSGGVYIARENPFSFDLAVYRNLSPDFVKNAFSFRESSSNVKILKKKTPFYACYRDLKIAKNNVKKEEGLKSIAVIPVFKGEKLLACLNISSHVLDQVPHNSRRVLETLSMLIGNFINRMSAEKDMSESEQKYKNLLYNLPQKVFYKDKDSVYVAVNPAFAKDCGLAPEDFPGKTDFDFFSRELAEKYRNDDSQVVKKGRIKSFDEKFMSGGKSFTVHTMKVPLKNAEGKTEGVLGIFWDVSDRVAALRQLQSKDRKLNKAIEGIVTAIAHVVESKDPYTAGHQERVSMLACAIAEKMGLSSKEIEGLKIATAIHDMGKIFVPMDILTKPSRLRDIEFNLIKMHPEEGARILRGIDFPWPIAGIISQHHERMNGKGYPLGLPGKKICIEARIIAVADTVEAMSSHRPYRPAFTLGDALGEIEKNAGVLYDRDVAAICLKLFKGKEFSF